MARRRPGTAGFAALVKGLVGLVLLPGCGKRGDPLAPFPRTPQAVTELKLSQRGESLVVTYLTPRVTTGGQRLPVIDVEMQRAEGAGDFGKLATKNRTKAAPGETVVARERLPAPGTQVRVAVRALSGGQPSSLTPVVSLTVQPPPPAPTELTARLVPDGVVLAWRAPVLPSPAPTPSPVPTPSPTLPPASGPTPTPSPAVSPSPVGSHSPAVASPSPVASSPSPVAASPSPPPPPGFWVYRRDKTGTYGRPLAPETAAAPKFADPSAQPGQSVCYVVRLVVAQDPVVESADSNEACVEVRDVKAPATPSGVTALAREGAVELSWSPTSDPDVALYRIYRTAAGGAPERVAEVPAGESSFRDPAGVPGRAYTVTAVDAAGNESAPSKPAEVTVP